jgi:hypothetical protein
MHALRGESARQPESFASLKDDDQSLRKESTEKSKIDPVNEPDYNMRNITKQSILLEEHLAEASKYCKSCITKHFLHIIGLAEEATWMAGRKLDDYPFLRDSVPFYQRTFDRWVANRDDEDVKREVLDTLRSARRALIDAYFLK